MPNSDSNYQFTHCIHSWEPMHFHYCQTILFNHWVTPVALIHFTIRWMILQMLWVLALEITHFLAYQCISHSEKELMVLLAWVCGQIFYISEKWEWLEQQHCGIRYNVTWLCIDVWFITSAKWWNIFWDHCRAWGLCGVYGQIYLRCGPQIQL